LVVLVPRVFCCGLWGWGRRFCIINFTNTIFLSLSYPLHFLSFSCDTIHCSPLNYSFCPLSPSLSSIFTTSSYPPNLSPHYPIFPTHSHLLTSLLYQLYTIPAPCNPDTSILHYNNRNIPKHAQGPQNPATPISLPLPTHLFLVPLLPIAQISISVLTTIMPPTLTVYRYYHQEVFYIICKQCLALNLWICYC
jgi:hypothetical protein